MYLHLKIVLSLALLTVILGSAFSTEVTSSLSLSLEQALGRAESRNPVIELHRQRLEASRQKIQIASAWPDPKFQITQFGESVQTRTGSQERVYGFMQRIPAWGQITAKRNAAKNETSAQAQHYLSARLALRVQLTHAYADAFYFEKARASTQESLALIEMMQAVAKENLRTGESVNKLLRFELEAERAADNLAQWVQKSEAARSQLAAILNLKSGNLGSLKDLSATGYKFGTPAEMLRRLQNRNPSLQALREKASAAAEATRLSRQERLPSFALGLNYIELDGSQSASANSGKDPWGLTLSVNLPIWQGKQRAAVQATRAHQRAIDATLRQRELELRGMLEAEISRHRDSLERMDRYTKHLIPLAEQSLEYSRNTYSTGQVGVLELLDSEQALLDLRLRYWGALADMHRAEASLLALIASHPEAKQPIRKHK